MKKQILLFIFFFISIGSFAADNDQLIEDDSLKILLNNNDKISVIKYLNSYILRQDSIASERYKTEVKALQDKNFIDKIEVENQVARAKAKTKIVILGIILLSIMGVLLFLLTKKIKSYQQSISQLKIVSQRFKKNNDDVSNLMFSISNDIKDQLDNSDIEIKAKSKIIYTSLKKLLPIILFVLVPLFAFSQEDTSKKGLVSEEMEFINRINKAKSVRDTEEAYNILQDFKAFAYKNSMFDKYFRVFSGYYTMISSMGDIEKSKIAAKELLGEAIEINHIVGITYAYVVEAEAFMFSRDNQEVINVYNKLFEFRDDVEDRDKAYIYLRMVNAYYNLYQYNNALEYLNKRENIIKKLYKSKEISQNNYQVLIDANYFWYSSVYYKQKNYKGLEKSLSVLGKTIESSKNLSTKIGYYSKNAFLLAHKGRKSESLESFDKCLNMVPKSQPLYYMSILREKVDLCESLGMLDEVIDGMIYIKNANDSIYDSWVKKQEVTIEENYRFESTILTKAKIANAVGVVTIVFIVLLILASVAFIYFKLLLVRKEKKALAEVENTTSEIDSLLKFKQTLLFNLNKELNPSIVNLKEAIEEDDNAAMSSILSDMSDILHLVISFSYLQEGKVNFNITNQNIVDICYKVVDEIRLKNNQYLDLNIDSDVDFFMFEIDKDIMIKILKSVLDIPIAHSDYETIVLKIIYGETGNDIVLEISGSLLAKPKYINNISNLSNNINSLYLKQFNSTYQIENSNLRPIVRICLAK